MRCPHCGSLEDKVIDSRSLANGEAIRRRRECISCGLRFTSYERIEEKQLMVVKRDGRREPFERMKIERGLIRALEKRPISQMSIENFVNEIEGISKIYANIKKPFVAILGGNKVLDKWPLALALRKKAKHIILGGVMANTYLAGLDGRGVEIGASVVDKEALKKIKFPLSFSDDFTIPVDFVVINQDCKIDFVMSMDVGEEDVIMDTGFFSFQNIQQALEDAKTIF